MRSITSVPDTNVIIAIHRSVNPESPNKEFWERWSLGDFDIEYSTDTLVEYMRKLQEHGVERSDITDFVSQLMRTARPVRIEHFHLPTYPADADDIAFVLCADNGNATHLVSYDNHLLDLGSRYSFRICRTVEFLQDLRTSQTNE